MLIGNNVKCHRLFFCLLLTIPFSDCSDRGHTTVHNKIKNVEKHFVKDIGSKSYDRKSKSIHELNGGASDMSYEPLKAFHDEMLGSGDLFYESKEPQALNNSHFMSIEECLESLMTSEQFGLSSLDASFRLSKYGKNVFAQHKSRSIFEMLVEQFEDRLVQILLGVAFLSAILSFFENDGHAFIEPITIISILIVNAIVGIYHGKSAEDSLEALKKLQPETACVLRDEMWQGNLPVADIVPGDIIQLRVGDKIPADARIIALKTISFSTDESSLTGESATVFKHCDPVEPESNVQKKLNMVFSGTMVTSGSCYALVTKTGMATEIGSIDAGIESAKKDQMKTPLSQQLDEFGNELTKLVLMICVSVWLVNIPKFSSPYFVSKLSGALYYAKTAVALGVAAIPEGLPAVITLCLSLGTGRMAKRNVIVRNLPSVETLGCTSVICTDKTGTLTTNMMVVKSLVTFSSHNQNVSSDESNYCSDRIISGHDKHIYLRDRYVEGISYEPLGRVRNFDSFTMNSEGLKDLATICSLCNEANIDYRDGVFRAIGEPTEAALKALVEKLGVPAETPSSLDTVVYPQDAYTIAHRCGDHWTSLYDRLAVLEFNRDRKSMSALCRPKPSYGGTESKPVKNRLLVKGAAEVVLARCNRLKLEDGTVIPIDDHLRKEIEKKLSEMASRPHRCLAMAYSDSQHILGDLQSIKTAAQAVESPSLRDSTRFIEFERNMVLVGICGIKDPARPEASEAILTSKKAGIRVMMITGDSKDTAVAIAREVNIFSAEEDVSQSAFTGAEFFDLPQDKQLELLKYGNKVFCRTEPRDKQQLIALLERLGEVTAMTGDGVNDAPALQQADIGIAMGITGTEVAKSAADMVLTDDNFATILNAVEEGRNIYSNMQTFICFLISCNIGEIATVFVASLLGLPEPLNPLHLLWVNLVTDGPPATALGFNPPDPGAMEKPPRSRNESILSKWLLIRYLVTGCYVGLATIGAFFWWYLDKGISFTQLMTWGRCSEWNGFTHSLPMKNACDIFSMRAKPQSLSLSVLVTIEMLKALSAVSLENSLWRVPPWKNRWLLVGVIVPFLMHLLILNVPLLATPFGLSPLSLKEWKIVLLFSIPILFVEEILKLIGRYGFSARSQRQF